MNIIISNSSGQPIYEQIISQIKAMIISGELKEGDALPSMRLLSLPQRERMRSWSGKGLSSLSPEKAALWPVQIRILLRKNSLERLNFCCRKRSMPLKQAELA